MKNKNYLIIGGVIIAIIAAYFLFFKKKSATVGPVAIGKKKDGTPFYQSDVDDIVKYIKADTAWYDKIKKSMPSGTTIEQALIDNALYTLKELK